MGSIVRVKIRSAARLFCLVCISLLALTWADPSISLAEDETLTVFVAKKIITMDSTNPEATAVAVRGDRIVGVGSMDDLKPWLDAYPHEIDTTFAEKFLMPGLIDPHLHPMLGAIQLQLDWATPESWVLHDARVDGITTPEGFWERITNLLEENTNTEDLYIVWGWSEPYHGPLGRSDLDKIAPDRPVMMLQRSVHEGVFNSAALEMLGLTEEDVKNHPQADQVDWERAHFVEGGFFDIALPLLAPVLFAPEFIDPGYARNVDYLRSRGVTTAGDMATGGINWDLELAALKRNIVDKEVPLRVVLIPDAFKMGPQYGGLDSAFEFVDEQLNGGSLPYPLVGGKRIKLFADGAMFSLLMVLGPPGYVGFGQNEWITPKDEFFKLAEKYWNEGYKIHVHTNGDGGVEFVLDVFHQLQFEKPRSRNSLTLEHYGYSNEHLNRRVAEFGAAVSANPYYVTFLADLYSGVGLGPDRARRITPLRGLVDRGVLVALHSDFGMAPADPLALAWSAITRTSLSGKRMTPPAGLTLDEGLKAITVDAAHVLGLEKDIGSIEAGKLADFAVLEEDPYAIPVDELKDIEVWGVVFEGVVHPGPNSN
ncbi:MAG: amidohydrolase [Pseudomonadota bacterium]